MTSTSLVSSLILCVHAFLLCLRCLTPVSAKSCLVLSCLVLSCLVLSCLVLSCLVLSCLVLSCLVLSCLVLSCLVLSCLVLSCLDEDTAGDVVLICHLTIASGHYARLTSSIQCLPYVLTFHMFLDPPRIPQKSMLFCVDPIVLLLVFIVQH